MQPVRNNILFRPFPPEEVTESGILVPDSAKKTNNKGTIVKVGVGTLKRKMKLKEGQIGYRVRDWGTEVMIDGQQHFLMDMDAILALDE